MQTLASIAAQHLKVFGNPALTASFLNDVVSLVGPLSPTEMALDSIPASLTGSSAMPSLRRTSRDQVFAREPGLGTGSEYIDPTNSRLTRPTSSNDLMRGGNQSIEARDQDPEEMTPETLAEFVKICASRLAANDDNGESHNNFMNLLGQMVEQAHQNGMLNGDRRARRRASIRGDQAGSPSGRATPAGGMANFNGRGSMDRRAMDSAFAVRGMNTKSFLSRFPEAKGITIRG